jgi:hypothetical protein
MIDLAGQRCGRLTVIRDSGRRQHGGVIWLCRCDCGMDVAVSSNDMRRKNPTKSCGCFRAEVASAIARSHLEPRHGHARREQMTGTYRSWAAMRQRCLNPNVKAFKNYGGRGITICERWQIFENFLADMGERPAGDYSIERINNDGNYEPSNCHWAERAEQSANQRRRGKRDSGNGRD